MGDLLPVNNAPAQSSKSKAVSERTAAAESGSAALMGKAGGVFVSRVFAAAELSDARQEVHSQLSAAAARTCQSFH